MAVTYGFYDSLNHDRLYNAQQMSAIFDGIINDGVFMSVGNQFHTVAGTGMQVIVKSGRAWFNSTWTLNDAEYPLSIDAADVLLTRIDAVVLEVNSEVATRANTIKVVKGTPASTPAKPTLTNTATIHQHALAYVTVAKNTTAITNSMIEIVVGKTETPYVTAILQTTDITDLFKKWESDFQIWFETVKGTLDGDVALNLQNQIDHCVKKVDKATDADIEAGTTDKWVDSASLVKTINDHEHIGSILFSAEDTISPLYAICDGSLVSPEKYPTYYNTYKLDNASFLSYYGDVTNYPFPLDCEAISYIPWNTDNFVVDADGYGKISEPERVWYDTSTSTYYYIDAFATNTVADQKPNQTTAYTIVYYKKESGDSVFRVYRTIQKGQYGYTAELNFHRSGSIGGLFVASGYRSDNYQLYLFHPKRDLYSDYGNLISRLNTIISLNDEEILLCGDGQTNTQLSVMYIKLTNNSWNFKSNVMTHSRTSGEFRFKYNPSKDSLIIVHSYGSSNNSSIYYESISVSLLKNGTYDGKRILDNTISNVGDGNRVGVPIDLVYIDGNVYACTLTGMYAVDGGSNPNIVSHDGYMPSYAAMIKHNDKYIALAISRGSNKPANIPYMGLYILSSLSEKDVTNPKLVMSSDDSSTEISNTLDRVFFQADKYSEKAITIYKDKYVKIYDKYIFGYRLPKISLSDAHAFVKISNG